jgi:hypothetical protein
VSEAAAVDSQADTDPAGDPTDSRAGIDEPMAAPDPTDEADPKDECSEADERAEAPGTPLRATRGESIGAAVGSFMGGIEQQVFQRRPPAVELVRQATPVRGTSGAGLQITIDVPPMPDRAP